MRIKPLTILPSFILKQIVKGQIMTPLMSLSFRKWYRNFEIIVYSKNQNFATFYLPRTFLIFHELFSSGFNKIGIDKRCGVLLRYNKISQWLSKGGASHLELGLVKFFVERAIVKQVIVAA